MKALEVLSAICHKACVVKCFSSAGTGKLAHVSGQMDEFQWPSQSPVLIQIQNMWKGLNIFAVIIK